MDINWKKRDDSIELLDILTRKGSLKRFEIGEILAKNEDDLDRFLIKLQTQSTIQIEPNQSNKNLDVIKLPDQVTKRSFEDFFGSNNNNNPPLV